MLKALGARNADLYRTVLAQAILSVLLGFLCGLVITWLLTLIIPFLGSGLSMEVSPASLLKVGGVSTILAVVSAMIPIRQIAGLDPVIVFRGR